LFNKKTNWVGEKIAKHGEKNFQILPQRMVYSGKL
jgi:hypothetical protein